MQKMNTISLESVGLQVSAVHRNLPPAELYEHAIRHEHGSRTGKPAARRKTNASSNTMPHARMCGGAP
jgi:hypothetical protein